MADNLKIKQDGTVLRDGEEVGTVYRKETTKTGFKRGYCVGQVRCTRWFAKTLDGKELGQRDYMLLTPGYRTRVEAAEALLSAQPVAA